MPFPPLPRPAESRALSGATPVRAGADEDLCADCHWWSSFVPGGAMGFCANVEAQRQNGTSFTRGGFSCPRWQLRRLPA